MFVWIEIIIIMFATDVVAENGMKFIIFIRNNCKESRNSTLF